MAAACKKAGLKFGVYYSQAQDWHHPGGAAYGGHWDKAQDGDLHQYVQKIAAPQVHGTSDKVSPRRALVGYPRGHDARPTSAP